VRSAVFAPGVDIKADGGYVVAPPSVHPSGHEYRWHHQCLPDETPLADLPSWIDGMLSPIVPSRGGASQRSLRLRQLVQCGLPEGSRNDGLVCLIGYLLRRYVDPLVALHLTLAWNQLRNHPPLSDEEVIRTVESIAGRERQRRANQR
jgi:hypothetical protein